MKLSPDAILFDMDGVLVDSLKSWWKSLNAALKNYKEDEISREEFIEKFWGNELKKNLKKLGLEEKIGVFCKNIYYDYLDEVEIYNDVEKTLKKLRKYPKAIITNTPRKCTMKILTKFNIKKYFDIIITSDQINNGKPEPDMIFKACKKLKVEPKNTVLIGDTKNDVRAGRAAGCKIIGIDVKADYTVNKVNEIIDLFNT